MTAKRLKKPLSFRGASSIWWFERARALAVFLTVGGFLAACGFEPVHRLADTAPVTPVALMAQLNTPETPAGRLLRRALVQRLGQERDAPFDISAKLEQASEDSQLDAQGIAQRLRLSFALRLRVTDNTTGAQRTKRFSQTLFVSRGTSGAEDQMRRRAQTELAMRRLADQAAAFIRAQARAQEQMQNQAQDQTRKQRSAGGR